MKLSFNVDSSIFIEVKTKYTPKAYQSFVEGFMKYLSGLIIQEVKDVVLNHPFAWKPLSPRTLFIKKKLKLGKRTWYSSGQLLNSIKYWKSNRFDGYVIGVNPRLQHNEYKVGGISSRKTKTKMLSIIYKLEYGNSQVPARPLFRPIFSKYKMNINKHYQTYVKLVKTGKIK